MTSCLTLCEALGGKASQRGLTARFDRRSALRLGVALSICKVGDSVYANSSRTVVETVVDVELGKESGRAFGPRLQTTVYRRVGSPGGAVLVALHGSAGIHERGQGRWRPSPLARVFVEMGYVVLVPMRSGYAGSTGRAVRPGCDPSVLTLHAGREIADFMVALERMGDLDTRKIVLLGHSAGLLPALGAAALRTPAAVVVVAGFFRGPPTMQCGDDSRLLSHVAMLGEKVKAPSLWLYADNDSYVPIQSARSLFAAYSLGKSDSRWLQITSRATEGHDLLSEPVSQQDWEPHVQRFLRSVGLPGGVGN